MAVAMKGLLKGLRFISHIFEEDEREMKIGDPTDVRHVAHIGWDGPTASAPSWMDKYKGDGDSGSPSSPARDSVQTGSESVEESPSQRRTKVSRSVESKAQPSKQSRRKKKGSSRTSAKPKTGNVDETGSEADLEGG